jgi:mono/diheme cytochrome c family protein
MSALKPPLVAVALMTLGLLALAAAEQGPRPSQPPLVIRSTFGADLYQFYCSSCHGPTGKGGTVRSRESTPPPDLTVLARLNNGVFPRDRVRDAIRFGPTASRLAAHGTADMPVWGAVFRGLDPNDEVTEIRIENLVLYIASLQEAAKAH